MARTFAQMIRKRNASALESWLEEASASGIPELRTFATGIKRDKYRVIAAQGGADRWRALAVIVGTVSSAINVNRVLMRC